MDVCLIRALLVNACAMFGDAAQAFAFGLDQPSISQQFDGLGVGQRRIWL